MSGSEKPQRGPDKNSTAPRTRFTKRISYSVWGRRAQAAARELYGLYGKQHSFVSLHTYSQHDQDPIGAMKRGESQSVDLYVTPHWNDEPTAEQLAVGQQMVSHACRNWTRLGLDKIIWKNAYTRNGKDWYDYRPYIKRYKHWGLAKAPTKAHRNHPHMRFGVWR